MGSGFDDATVLPFTKGRTLKDALPALVCIARDAVQKLGHQLLEPMAGFEPATYGLRNRCSTPELHRQGIEIVLLLTVCGSCLCRRVHYVSTAFEVADFASLIRERQV